MRSPIEDMYLDSASREIPKAVDLCFCIVTVAQTKFEVESSIYSWVMAPKNVDLSIEFV